MGQLADHTQQFRHFLVTLQNQFVRSCVLFVQAKYADEP
jgi:hypothetical protein